MPDNITEFDTAELAGRYDRVSDSQFGNGKDLLEVLGVGNGDRVLDFGSGTGRLAAYAAGLVGKTGQILGIEPSAHRVAVAREKIRYLPQVMFRIGSDRDLECLPDNSFDKAYMVSVFHHIRGLPAKEKALLNIYRILKPGGLLGISDPDKNSPSVLRSVTREVLVSCGIEPEDEESLGRDELRNYIHAAGFGIIALETFTDSYHFDDARRLIEFSEASHFGNYLREVPGDLQEQVRERIAEHLWKLQKPEGIDLVRTRLFCVAIKISGRQRDQKIPAGDFSSPPGDKREV